MATVALEDMTVEELIKKAVMKFKLALKKDQSGDTDGTTKYLNEAADIELIFHEKGGEVDMANLKLLGPKERG